MQGETARKIIARIAVGTFVLMFAGLLYLSQFPEEKWVKETDLLIQFTVIDVSTNQPVPDATVHLVDQEANSNLTLLSNHAGQADQLLNRCITFGMNTPLGNTWNILFPEWWYHASAKGYETGSPKHLIWGENIRRVKIGDKISRLEVPIFLNPVKR